MIQHAMILQCQLFLGCLWPRDLNLPEVKPLTLQLKKFYEINRMSASEEHLYRECWGIKAACGFVKRKGLPTQGFLHITNNPVQEAIDEIVAQNVGSEAEDEEEACCMLDHDGVGEEDEVPADAGDQEDPDQEDPEEEDPEGEDPNEDGDDVNGEGMLDDAPNDSVPTTELDAEDPMLDLEMDSDVEVVEVDPYLNQPDNQLGLSDYESPRDESVTNVFTPEREEPKVTPKLRKATHLRDDDSSLGSAGRSREELRMQREKAQNEGSGPMIIQDSLPQDVDIDACDTMPMFENNDVPGSVDKSPVFTSGPDSSDAPMAPSINGDADGNGKEPVDPPEPPVKKHRVLPPVLTRRDQLGMRQRKGKNKNKKGDDQDDEGVKVPKGDVKPGRKKKDDEKTTEKPPRKPRKAKNPKGTEASDGASKDGDSKGGEKKPMPKGKAKSSPKKKASPKTTPKASPKKRARCSGGGKSARAASSSPRDASVDAPSEKLEKPQPKRRSRKAEWIDQQAAENDNFDMFTEPVRTHMESIKDVAMKAIEEYKSENRAEAADID
eukprot:s2451_g10.t1